MHLFEIPLFYNSLRGIIAGDQIGTKSFVRSWISSMQCGSIVDIGCGTGDFFDPSLTLPYAGIDSNALYINHAKRTYRTYSQAQFVCDNVLTSPLLSSQYHEAVLLISVMHHLSDADCEQLFRLIATMRPKVFLIADIIPYPPGRLQRCMVRLDRGHYIRPPEEKLALVQRFFSIIHSEFINSRLAIQHGIVCIPLQI
ncbi:MAG: class I SAM-dependent methyltransferase [Patescibacteria group bacterium]